MPTTNHPLDRPVRNSLIGRWRPLTLQSGDAMRLGPEYGFFAATPELTPQSLGQLAGFSLPGARLDVVEPHPIPAPSGFEIDLQGLLAQMTAAEISPGGSDFDVLPLGEADGPEMLALADLTRPGPFAARTHALGAFIGIRSEGRLVAMAGERMRMDGFCEVSGVCTHPDFRGRGYAGGLMRLVARRILERGETPFLHCFETNTGAIALYETLGFRLRRALTLTVLRAA